MTASTAISAWSADAASVVSLEELLGVEPPPVPAACRRQQPQINLNPQTNYCRTNNITSTCNNDSVQSNNHGDNVSNNSSSDCLVAMCEGKGASRGELGLAMLENVCNEIHLYQFVDNLSYDKVTSLLEAIKPGVILISATTSASSYAPVGAAAAAKQQQTIPELFKIVSNRDAANATVSTDAVSSNAAAAVQEEAGIASASAFAAANSQLNSTLRTIFQPRGSVIRAISRRYFNITEGLKVLRRCCIGEALAPLELQLKSKSFCIAALSALVHYVEDAQRMFFATASIQILYKAVEDTTIIDAVSARNLELIASARPDDAPFVTTSNLRAQGSHYHNQYQLSLYTVLNRTQTRIGARLLRVNIMQPPKKLETIRTRLETVEELMGNEQLLMRLRTLMQTVVDVDRLIYFLICIPQRESPLTAEYRVENFVALKHLLLLVEPLRNALAQSSSSLLQGYFSTLNDERFVAMSTTIDAAIAHDALYVKGVLQLKMQTLFALRPGLNGMVDVSRQAFTECMRDMNEMVSQLARKYKLDLKLDYDKTRGFHLSLRAPGGTPSARRNFQTTNFAGINSPAGASRGAGLKPADLPREFIKISRIRNQLHFTTPQIMRCNACAQASLAEVCLASSQELLPIIDKLRQHMSVLYSLAEAIAHIDMLTGLVVATTTASFGGQGGGRGYHHPNQFSVGGGNAGGGGNSSSNSGEVTVPNFSDTSLAILKSRHPLMPFDRVVANDIFASRHENVTILTGPNMSGKSTYLRQIALLQIMAQTGVPLPAEFAVVRVCDQIFTRFGCDDDIETNASSFSLEMRELNFILRNCTERSLIIIDELGRGTRADEGAALCFAIAEELAKRAAFVWLATHYTELSVMATIYPSVRTYHFQCSYTVAVPPLEDVPRLNATPAPNDNVSIAAESVATITNNNSSATTATTTTTNVSMKFNSTHRLIDGACTTQHYGLALAAAMCIPRDIITEAQALVSDTDTRFFIKDVFEMEMRNLQVRYGARLINAVQASRDSIESCTPTLPTAATAGAATRSESTLAKHRQDAHRRQNNNKLFEVMQQVKREYQAEKIKMHKAFAQQLRSRAPSERSRAASGQVESSSVLVFSGVRDDVVENASQSLAKMNMDFMPDSNNFLQNIAESGEQDGQLFT